MSKVKVCFCTCGGVCVQAVSDPPKCHRCGSDDVDWMHVESKSLKEDLEQMWNLLDMLDGEARDA